MTPPSGPAPPAPLPVQCRPARAGDLERILDIHASAFPDSRGREERVRQLTAHPLAGDGDLWVAALGDDVVGHALLFDLGVWFGGATVRAGGIASVGVAPEARRRGVASALLARLHEVARERGAVLTVLYPFRQRFYAQRGYSPAAAARRLHMCPRSIPWTTAARARPARGGDLPSLQACWEAVGRRRSGTLVRPTTLWEAGLVDEGRVWLVIEDGGSVRGYVAWTLLQREDHTGTRLVVRERGALDDAADRAVWAVIAAQRDQVRRVVVDVAADDPVDAALVDADREPAGEPDAEHVLGEIVAGPMLRLLDPERALAARGWPVDGDLVLELEGSVLRLAARGGSAALEVSTAEPEIRLDRRVLAAVAFGTLRARDAARLGLVVARDERALRRADELFGLSSYFSPDRF